MKRFAFTFLSRIYGALANLLVNVFVAQQLTTDDAGAFFFALTILLGGAMATRFGIDNLLLKEVSVKSDRNEDLKTDISSALFLSVILGFIVSLIIYVGTISSAMFDLLDVQTIQSIQFLSLVIIPFASIIIFSGIYKGFRKPVVANIIEAGVMPSIFLIAANFIVFYNGSINLLEILKCLIFAILSTFALNIFLLNKRSLLDVYNIQKVVVKNYFNNGKPLAIVALSDYFVMWASLIILGLYASSTDISYYSIAQRMAILISFVLIVMNSIYAPKYAVLWSKGDTTGLNENARSSSTFMMVLAIPALLVCLIYPQQLLLIFGEDYQQADSLLMILAFAQFINVFTGSNGYILMMTGHEREFRNIILFSAIITIISSFLLIPAYGVVGAAFATLIGIVVKNGGGTWLVFKKVGVLSVPYFTVTPIKSFIKNL
jgi:O-antigen/teichoic acid export membrane protein